MARIYALAVICIGKKKINKGGDDVKQKDGKYLRGRFGSPYAQAY
jgi:hypothetical protein